MNETVEQIMWGFALAPVVVAIVIFCLVLGHSPKDKDGHK